MNQPDKPRTHLFSPHTDQWIYCGKSAQDDAIENTPCASDQQNPCEVCGGRGWIFIDTGDDHFSRYEIKRCEACETYDSDLEAFAAVEKITQLHPALLRFVKQIADLKHEGEPGDDGPYEIASEDTIATLNELILGARQLQRLHGSSGQGKIVQPTTTKEQEIAVRSFIDSWSLSMPYHDIGSALNCGECNALHKLLMAFGNLDAAKALMQAHAAGDDEGDDPDHLRIKAAQEKMA